MRFSKYFLKHTDFKLYYGLIWVDFISVPLSVAHFPESSLSNFQQYITLLHWVRCAVNKATCSSLRLVTLPLFSRHQRTGGKPRRLKTCLTEQFWSQYKFLNLSPTGKMSWVLNRESKLILSVFISSSLSNTFLLFSLYFPFSLMPSPSTSPFAPPPPTVFWTSTKRQWCPDWEPLRFTWLITV